MAGGMAVVSRYRGAAAPDDAEFPMRADRESREGHQVVHVGNAVALAGARCRARVMPYRSLQQLIEAARAR